MEVVKFNSVGDRIMLIRDIPVLLGSDVAKLYGVETRKINQAVKNNLNKFPNEEYIFELTGDEKREIIKSFNNSKVKFSPKPPTIFTEKVAYKKKTKNQYYVQPY